MTRERDPDGATEALGAVVLNWNGGRHVLECVASLGRARPYVAEVIVVDNGSTDGSPEAISDAFPFVNLIRLPTNIGYSAGMRAGLAASASSLIWLLNNDVVVSPEAAPALISAFTAARRSVVGLFPRIVNIGDWNTTQTCGLRWSATAKVVPVPEYQHSRSPRRVFGDLFIAPCFRRKALTESNAFDEDFTIGAEDFDVSYKLNMLGHELWTCPSAVVAHIGSASLDQWNTIDRRVTETRRFLEIVLCCYELPSLLIFGLGTVARVWLWRGLLHSIGTDIRRLPTTAVRYLSLIVDVVRSPSKWQTRRQYWQARRQVGDRTIWSLGSEPSS